METLIRSNFVAVQFLGYLSRKLFSETSGDIKLKFLSNILSCEKNQAQKIFTFEYFDIRKQIKTYRVLHIDLVLAMQQEALFYISHKLKHLKSLIYSVLQIPFLLGIPTRLCETIGERVRLSLWFLLSAKPSEAEADSHLVIMYVKFCFLSVSFMEDATCPEYEKTDSLI